MSVKTVVEEGDLEITGAEKQGGGTAGEEGHSIKIEVF